MKPWRSHALLLLACAAVLMGCENAAAPFMIDGQDHAVSLIREQRYFWNDEVEQALVVARLPRCQRRFAIAPGNADAVNLEVFEARSLLWAFRQGRQWYLVSTEKCLVQEWKDAPSEPPGRAIGAFRRRDGQLVFVTSGDAEQAPR